MKKLIFLLLLFVHSISFALTPVWCCGFECGIATTSAAHFLISGPSYTEFSTTIVRSGARTMRHHPTNQSYSYSQHVISGNMNVYRFYVYFATLPNVNCFISGVSINGIIYGACFRSSDSRIYPGYSNDATPSFTFGSSSFAPTTGVWYRIDIKVNSSNNPFTIDVQVDGTALTQLSRAVAAFSADALNFGTIVSTSTTADIYYDDVVLSNTESDYPIGAGYVNHFIPTSDGTHNIAGANDFERTLTGTDILNSTTTAYQLMDDIPLESGSGVDWINMKAPAGSTDGVRCNFGNAPGISTPTTAPRAVEVICGIHQAGSGNGNMVVDMIDNTSGNSRNLYTGNQAPGVTAIAYKRAHFQYNFNVSSNNPWTLATFTNVSLKFSSGPTGVDANPDQYLDCIMIEAEFAPLAKPHRVNLITRNTLPERKLFYESKTTIAKVSSFSINNKSSTR